MKRYGVHRVTHITFGSPLMPGLGFRHNDGTVNDYPIMVGFDDGLKIFANSVPEAIETANASPS